MSSSPRYTEVPDYLGFFGLRDHPFRITPDTDYFYPSRAHKAALEALKYGILRREGFLVLTGEPGTGKTLLIRMLFRELPEEVVTAMVLTPALGPEALFEAVLEDLEIRASGSKEAMLKTFRDYLFELSRRGRTLLLVIDEAQNLPPESLEELRLLSNFETEKGKLLQILLSGQPALEEKLRSPELAQLAQRITVWERLSPFSREEVADYVRFRLARAGGAGIVFSRGAEGELTRLSGGIPRVINKIMDRALLVAFARGTHRLSPGLLREAAEAAALPSTAIRTGGKRIRWMAGLVLLVLLLGLAYVYLVGR
ncbi:ExeA family protein [Thermosulfurimonas sp. F29]|uniref:ExeA family protein n=1 Tax=Thermosulfurimonas sp. F29 TaxID=2867247 RepID=UPI001C836FD5|nr:AAA family ATPase [Thermosulfurimonas sp. F29]MBX6422132.1 AAA family ATPase [Thermosulfurimonas sp. F29]